MKLFAIIAGVLALLGGGAACAQTSPLSVVAAGARGDGRSDDSAAIQRAIDSGRAVTFPKGVYRLGRPVRFSGPRPTFEPGATVAGPGTLLGLTYLHADWFGIVADDDGRGTGTVQNANLARLGAAIGDGTTVEFPDTGARYIRVSGAAATRAPLTIVAALDITDKTSVTLRGHRTRVLMSDFTAAQAIDLTKPYYGGGIYFFVRLLRCRDCVVEGFTGLGTFPLDARYPPGARGALSRASFIHVQQSQRITIRNNEARQMWGNLVNAQSVANRGAAYSTWFPYEDVAVTDNFAADCAESAVNFMGGGFRGLIARNTSVNCIGFAESASHGVRISNNVVRSTWDNRHRQAAVDGGGPVAGAISVIGNDSVIDGNVIQADIGWIDEQFMPGAWGYLLGVGIDVRNQGGARAPIPPWQGLRARITNNQVIGAYTNAIKLNATNHGAIVSGNTLVTQKDVSRGVTQGRATAALAGGGVRAVTVAAAGAGYTYPPLVILGGGGGAGAQAVARISAGRIVAIDVTNPGKGYAAAPAVKLVGGAAGASGIVASDKLHYGIRIDGRPEQALANVEIRDNQIDSASFGIAFDHVRGLTVHGNAIRAGQTGILGDGERSSVADVSANAIAAGKASLRSLPGKPGAEPR